MMLNDHRLFFIQVNVFTVKLTNFKDIPFYRRKIWIIWVSVSIFSLHALPFGRVCSFWLLYSWRFSRCMFRPSSRVIHSISFLGDISYNLILVLFICVSLVSFLFLDQIMWLLTRTEHTNAKEPKISNQHFNPPDHVYLGQLSGVILEPSP